MISRLYTKLQGHPELHLNMDGVCSQFHISRQAHYQMLHRRSQNQAKAEVMLELVRQVRRKHPHMGTRKLLHNLHPMLAREEASIGRDRLLALLRSQDLLVKRKKRHRHTTIPGLFRTPNLLPGLCIDHPNQVWVSDITYVEVEAERFVYLFLLMDLYSRFILGWHLSGSLMAEGALCSLYRALQHRPQGSIATIHHSDHGVQYSSHAYLDTLTRHGLRASMGAVGNCYDNIFAERVIGTLKNEYCLGDRFVDRGQVQRLLPEVVYLYNEDRPHLSLDMRTPSQVYHAAPALVKPFFIPEAAHVS